MKVKADEYYSEMQREEVINQLKKLNEYNPDDGLTKMRKKLQKISTTRHLQIWHDHSTLANTGHIIFTVNCLYDPAIYMTDKEYKDTTGKVVDVQTEIEKPHVYIVARCRSCDAEQLAYVETRLCCLQHLQKNLKTADGVEIKDKMRFFHGDSPSREFESGQQKGGHYYCSGCGAHADRVYELDYCFRCEPVSLEDRQNIVMKGPIGKRNSFLQKPKPFSALTREELESELGAREIYEGKTKKELQNLLYENLHGVSRVPALLFTNPSRSLESLNLGNYEVLPCEPMHDIAHHIENLLTELPSHIEDENCREKLVEAVTLTTGKKETKRAVDFRCSLLTTSLYVQGTASSSVQSLLDTMVDMQDILYKEDKHRSPRLILRYHNSSWYHLTLCRSIIGFNLKSKTVRKFYGTYLHDLTAHAPLQLRLVSGRTSSAEEKERTFNTVKSITNTTSSYRPAHIISNIFIRLQAEEKLGRSGNCVEKQQSHVSRLAHSLPPQKNTKIPKTLIKKYSSSWQAHLERISDFLLPGEGVWWSQDDDFVEFFDACGEAEFRDEGPPLHHFRSSTLKNEDQYLKRCWQQCLEREVIIPTHIIRDESQDGKVMRIYTDYLTGPLFAELAAKIALGHTESDDMSLEPDSKHLTTSFNNALEEDPEEENSGETVAEFRLIGGEQPEDLNDDNLLGASPVTKHKEEAKASGMIVIYT